MAAGRDAIDAALDALYPADTDLRFAGAERSDGQPPSVIEFAVYAASGPPAHWHYVTYGLTEIFEKEQGDPETSGFGFELTFRLRRLGEDAPPHWPMRMLTTVADYVYDTGNALSALHVLSLPGRLSLGPDTRQDSLLLSPDPQLPPVRSVNGNVAFLQCVGISPDEDDLIARWDAREVRATLAEGNPLLVTDPRRPCPLDDPSRAATLRERARAAGSSREVEFLPDVEIDVESGMNRTVVIRADETSARVLARALEARVRLGRRVCVHTAGPDLHLVPAAVGYEAWTGATADEVTLGIPPDRLPELLSILRLPPGRHAMTWFPELAIERV